MLGEEKEEIVAETVNKGLLVHTLCCCFVNEKVKQQELPTPNDSVAISLCNSICEI
jgi:hypothetical protein